MKMDWRYAFTNSTSSLMTQPVEIPARAFPFVAGLDGRFKGVARRYPGHLRYADSTSALGSGTGISDFDIDIVRDFTLQQKPGFDTKIRGFVVGNLASGDMELWYRFSDDTDGVLRKKSLTETPAFVGTYSGSTVDVYRTGVHTNLIGNDDNEYTFRAVYCSALFDADDGLGELPYFGGYFSLASGRVCYGIARLHPNGRFESIGTFNEPVIALCVYKNMLIAGGVFTDIDGQNANYLAAYDGQKWSPMLSGVDGHVRALCVWEHDSDEYLMIGGHFTHTDPDDANTVSNYLAEAYYDGTDWSYETAFSTHLNGAVLCLLDGRTTPANTDGVYVGGLFTTANGGTVNRVMRVTISGTTPTYVAIDDGSGHVGFNDDVWCLASHYVTALADKAVHVGGQFTDFGSGGGSSPAAGLCYMNGSDDLVRIGTSRSGYTHTTHGAHGVRSLCSTDTGNTSELYVGGSGLTIWNGTNLSCNTFKLDQAFAVTAFTGLETGGTTHSVHVYNSTTTLKAEIWTLLNVDGTIWWGGNMKRASARSWLSEGNVLWDVCSYGKFLYIMAANGEHRVLYWDDETSDFIVADFGNELPILVKPVSAVAAVSTGRLITGNYQGRFRYIDRTRNRFGPLSDLSEDVSFSTNTGSALYRYPSASALVSMSNCPITYQNVQAYSTSSSLSTTVAAGGAAYRVAEFPVRKTFRSWVLRLGWAETKNDGQGSYRSSLTDESFALFDDDNEIVNAVGNLDTCYTCALYQGCMFAVDQEDSFLRLRWSSTYQYQPENFPTINEKRLDITVEQASTCRFVQAGDFLLLFGGDRIYRIQKSGQSVGVFEIAKGYNMIWRDAYVSTGSQVYAVSDNGLLQIDGRTGAGQVMGTFDNVFYNRWRAQFDSADPNMRLVAGYDARMDCMFLHCVGQAETMCLWMTDGKVTFLPYNPVFNIATCVDLDTENVVRAYFFTNRRWFYTTNWLVTSGEAQTMTGFPLYTGQSTVKYNCKATSWAPSGADMVGTFTGNPFSTAGSSGSAIDVSPCYVAFLSGALKEQVFKVKSNTSNTLTLENCATTPDTADTVALSPVVMAILGSNLWGPSGPSKDYRKVTRGMRAIAGRVIETGHANHVQTIPLDSTYSLLVYGVVRNDDLATADPRSSDTAALLPAQVVSAGDATNLLAGTAVSTDDSSKNYAAVRGHGTILYPFVESLASNYQLELYELRVQGQCDPTEKSGPTA